MSKGGVTVKDVAAQKFIEEYSSHLKRSGKLKLPEWVDIVKTGCFKELGPYDADWYYIRAASLARKIYLNKGKGVNNFRHEYGGAWAQGCRRQHHRIASGRVIRHVLQQLESIKIVEIDQKGGGGRKITSKGVKELDRIAKRIQKKSAQAAAAAPPAAAPSS